MENNQQKDAKNKLRKPADNMGFARCGVEGNLRKFSQNTRKKPFHFFL